eukprot:jgi/Mesvir1/21075/Mv17228-RA.1
MGKKHGKKRQEGRSATANVNSNEASPLEVPAAAYEAALAAGLTRDVGKRWLDASKAGDVKSIKALLHEQDKAALLAYKGQGNSYGFVGHSALHWCAAKGHLVALRLLIDAGARVDCVNNASATPLHAAASNGEAQCVRALILEGGATPSLRDDFGESARDVAVRMGHQGVAEAIDQCTLVTTLRAIEPSQWSIGAMRGFLGRAGVNSGDCSEKHELVARVLEFLDSLPRPRRRPPGSDAPSASPSENATCPGPIPASAPAAPPSRNSPATGDAPTTAGQAGHTVLDTFAAGGASLVTETPPAGHLPPGTAERVTDAYAGIDAVAPEDACRIMESATTTMSSDPATMASHPAKPSSPLGHDRGIDTCPQPPAHPHPSTHNDSAPRPSQKAPASHTGNPPPDPSVSDRSHPGDTGGSSSDDDDDDRVGAPDAGVQQNGAKNNDSNRGGASKGATHRKTVAEVAKAKGNAAFSVGDYARAARSYTMALQLDADNHVLLSNRSGARCAMADYEGALEDGRASLAAAPTPYAKGHARCGAAYFGLGRLGDAMASYRAGIMLDPDNEGMKLALREVQAEARRMAEGNGAGGDAQGDGRGGDPGQGGYGNGHGAHGESDRRARGGDGKGVGQGQGAGSEDGDGEEGHGDGGSSDMDSPQDSPRVFAAPRRPWFDCPLCENKTRDWSTTACCAQSLCGTCARRMAAGVAPQTCVFQCAGS